MLQNIRHRRIIGFLERQTCGSAFFADNTDFGTVRLSLTSFLFIFLTIIKIDTRPPSENHFREEAMANTLLQTHGSQPYRSYKYLANPRFPVIVKTSCPSDS